MYKTLEIAFYETRMSSRGWRFWLLLGLIGGISFFARQDYLYYAKMGFFLHTGYSFQHPSFWLMIAILSIGTFAIALDISGRLRKTQMDKILYPLPVSAMELMWGRFLGVLFIAIPLSIIGLFSLGLWQELYGNGYVIWQPFAIAFFVLVLPIIVPLSAVAITVRTFFKHDFAAILAGAISGGFIWYAGSTYQILIDYSALSSILENTSPALGANFAFKTCLVPMLVHSLITLLILHAAPLYLRRQTQQKWIIKRQKHPQIWGISSLLRAITNLKFDPHLGWKYYLSLLSVSMLFSCGILGAILSVQNSNPKELDQHFANEISDQLKAGAVDTLRYSIEITPCKDYSSLEINAILTVQANEPLPQLGFELDPKFRMDEVLYNEERFPFIQTNEGIAIVFKNTIPKGETIQFTFRYHGKPKELHPHYSRLNTIWYPVAWQKIRTHKNGPWIQSESDLFDAEIVLHKQPNQIGAFAGTLLTQNNPGEEQWKTFYPVSALEITWGNFLYLEEDRKGYKIRFYHFPNNAYQSQVFLEEMKEQEEYVRERLGRLPFPQLTIIETPYQYSKENSVFNKWLSKGNTTSAIREKQESIVMPGILHISENDLSYLHDKIWLIERLDRDPRAIPFFQQLRPVLARLHQMFYRKLISVYFDHSLHPTGEYAFWIRDYLSGYASKLLEKNIWQRQQILNFDVGTKPELPLSVARLDSLLELHRESQYKDLERIRGEGLFRMLHHLLGEEKWWNLMKTIFQKYRFIDFPLTAFWQMIEESYGEDLSWFRKDWVEGNVLPVYEITLAEAKAIENIKTMGIDYAVSIRVQNHGTGRIHVPIYIETEGDDIFRDLWIDSGKEEILQIQVPNRPLVAITDPQHWILQEPFLNKEKQRREHSYQKITIIGDEK